MIVRKSIPFAAGSSEMHTVRFAFGMSKVVDIKNFGKPDKIANDITNKTNVFEQQAPAINSRLLIGRYTPYNLSVVIISVAIIEIAKILDSITWSEFDYSRM